MDSFRISGQFIDLQQRRIYPAELRIENGFIEDINEVEKADGQYILPGFTDAHVHIESSMLAPSAFAQAAVIHGTIATVSDPHEIANVCGEAGVDWMIADAKQVPFNCFFGAPSCVPATSFETAGAVLDSVAVDRLLQSPDIWYLSEMMNYPGVLQNDPEVVAKIEAAKKWNKPVDGHAPGLRGADAYSYAKAGISTDHECTTLEEALDKIAAGMHILIREGSAAKNFEALHSLISSHPQNVMLCSDDKHPDDLVRSHINELVKRALNKGHDLFDVLQAACINPASHYRLPIGMLRVGDPADFIVVENQDDWKPVKTFIKGQLVAEDGRCCFDIEPSPTINQFKAEPCKPNDFEVPSLHETQNYKVILAKDGFITTDSTTVQLSGENAKVQSDVSQDVLKLAVVNRYTANATPAIAWIKGFGLKQGAIASSVAHDCHNIIAVGVDDQSLCTAINAVIEAQGGISVASDPDSVQCLELPIAGLMSTQDAYKTGEAYSTISQAAKDLGSPLHAPFMTLSFMALLVIPSLKLSDKGLFDGNRFEFTSLEAA